MALKAIIHPNPTRPRCVCTHISRGHKSKEMFLCQGHQQRVLHYRHCILIRPVDNGHKHSVSLLSCDTGQTGVEGLDLFHITNRTAGITMATKPSPQLHSSSMKMTKKRTNRRGLVAFCSDAPGLLSEVMGF